MNIRISSLEERETEYMQKLSYCSVVELPQDEKTLLDLFTSNLRSNLKRVKNKAKREDVKIERTISEKDLHFFYHNIMAPQYVKEHRMIFQPFSLFRALIQDLKIADLYIAKVKGVISGGAIIINDGIVRHYNWGSTIKQSALPIGLLLIYESMRESIKKGFSYYDLGSTPLSHNGLLAFKRRFGSKDYSVYEYSTLRKSVPTDLHSDRKFQRKIFSLINPRIATCIMPFLVPWLIK